MSGLSREAKQGFRRAAVAMAVCALVLAMGALSAQQQAPPPSAPEPQQPGAGEQVHTGTTSGIDADQRIQNLLADHQFLRVEGLLGQLPADEAQLYRGILANRSNDLKTSIRLLEPLVAPVAASGNIAHEKLLRKALAEDYMRSGDMAKAADAYRMLAIRLQGHLSADEEYEIEMPLKMLPLAAANPPTTAEPCDAFSLIVAKNPLGLIDVPVFVDARSHSWMLDPTAPFNLIARSVAKAAGLKVSAVSATIHTLTGRPIEVHATVIPRFTLGGRLTLRNVTAFVFEDADYFFPRTQFQVEGVLGYPALSAVASLTVTSDDTIQVTPLIQVQPDSRDNQEAEAAQGARFFFDGDQMIVALGKPGKAGSERMYVVDAGGQQTYLTSRYYDEHSGDFAGQRMELFSIPGPQSPPPQPAYLTETAPLEVGPNTVHIHYIQVLTQPLGAAALDDVYGVLGVDALDQLKAYTFDYRKMRFSVKPE
jgi:hypothetical protein